LALAVCIAFAVIARIFRRYNNSFRYLRFLFFDICIVVRVVVCIIRDYNRRGVTGR